MGQKKKKLTLNHSGPNHFTSIFIFTVMLFIGQNVINIGHCMLFTLVFVSILKKKSTSSLSCCCCGVYLRNDILQLTIVQSGFSLAAVFTSDADPV